MKDFANSCIYQIYPKSFLDTTGNGVGDLNGITEKLDYLKELGVDYLWLTPFFLSPQHDNGYDIQDYYHIDPLFGTMEDLDRLIAEAAAREMGLMFDMVFNHTSTSHLWFQKALAGEAEYQDYYIFRKGSSQKPPTNWQSKFGGGAWEYVDHLGAWYLHLFDRTQADLNWDHPKVREEIKDIIRFWKKKGIKGFRFDVINLISKPEVLEDDFQGDGRRFYTDGPRVHQYLREMVEDTKLCEDTIITVGEMSSTTIDHCLLYSNPEEKQLKMCFHFHHLKVDYKDGDKWSLKPYEFQQLKEIFHTWQSAMAKGNGWSAVFWCNHDQPRAVSRFGDDKNWREESAKMLALTIHGMRGTPYIYQGEELGMTNACFDSIDRYRDVESIHYFDILKEKGLGEEEIFHILNERSRDNARTPMQWENSEHAGFTKGQPWICVNPNFRTINAAQALNDPHSIFYFYRDLIRLRKEYEVIRHGDYQPILEENPGIFAYKRTLGEETVLVLSNFTGEEQKVDLGHMGNGFSLLIGNYPEKEGGITCLRPFEGMMLYR